MSLNSHSENTTSNFFDYALSPTQFYLCVCFSICKIRDLELRTSEVTFSFQIL